ncbi:archaeal/vacuolar-type H+-ATPase subunit I [Thioflavicoccus mobilis 8321]|uniref:Archaeal/vacuolar-type H+-ATPase subunit I n=1 Tax=Thioflavicoccus mobilis 8321 TaxID=765912 RepID=L0GW91_9GAMM|nr:vacuolar-type H+-ATPase subunit I [Thioflavicoccus mobilis]AGA91013.1 archaeal/vacuolar-type H+-ATPase subunit I [Thioflavicoccus mobilis 8321]
MLRPQAARWLEVLCSRRDGVHTVATLAATGALEVELRGSAPTEQPLRHLAAGLAEYERLHARYGRYWERGRLRPSPLVGAPDAVLDLTLTRLAAWRREADPIISVLQGDEEELAHLRWLAAIIAHLTTGELDFRLVTESGPVLTTFCAILPREADPQLPPTVIARRVPWEGQQCLLILGPAAGMAAVKRQVQAVKGRVIERPGWLRGDAEEAGERLEVRCKVLASRIVHHYAELDALFDDFALGDVLGEVAWLAWFSRHVGALERAGDQLIWITGWTDDPRGHALIAALEQSQARAVLRFGAPPAEAHAPQILVNPRWLRPFELFTRALGAPGAEEADPTPILSVVVPFLFGYMFGDLGQGLVLAVLGGWLDRWLGGRRAAIRPLARLVLFCGLSSMAFGLLFGSLFGREDLIPALWLHPLDDPVRVLTVPLAFGVGLLSLGQLLAGLGAGRSGELGRWLRLDVGLLLLYLGLLGGLLRPGAAWSIWPGLAWYSVGALTLPGRWSVRFGALGELVERALQLFVNTLSFARVGAFALAHTALSAAIVTMAAAAPRGVDVAILVAGNLLVIVLEGLVVSIQTTRLVLFEFFNRFLHGTGRVFRPLPPPPAMVGVT